jgi:hypothetical protein
VEVAARRQTARALVIQGESGQLSVLEWPRPSSTATLPRRRVPSSSAATGARCGAGATSET